MSIYLVHSKCKHLSFYDDNNKKNQRRAIWREFEPVGPTLLKNPFGAG